MAGVGVPVTTGPQDPAAAGRDRLRARDADREYVLEVLKDAFVHGRLTKDELGARAGQALAARTYADLAALTADLPPVPAPAARPTAGPARRPALVRRPLVRAAAGSGSCLVFAFAVLLVGGRLDSPGPGPNPNHSWSQLCFAVALAAVVAAVGIVGHGVVSWDLQRSGRQGPPRPGSHAPAGERRDGTGRGQVPSGPCTDQTRADLRAHQSRQCRGHGPARAGLAPRGGRPAPGAV